MIHFILYFFFNTLIVIFSIIHGNLVFLNSLFFFKFWLILIILENWNFKIFSFG